MKINILKNSVRIDKLGWGNLIAHIDVDNTPSRRYPY